MKNRNPLSYYLDLIQSALDKRDWINAKRYGEISLKKLSNLTHSPFEECLLYSKIGYTYSCLAEYSRSLEAYNKAYLLALQRNLKPAYIADASFGIGHNLLAIKNINQALVQFQKVEQYYQKYGDGIALMGKQKYFVNLINLGYCYLYKNKLDKVQEIIEKKLSCHQPFPSEGFVPINYYHLKGEYLMTVKKYDQSRQSFQECIKFSEQFRFPQPIFATKIHLASIDLLESRLDSAVQILDALMKDAQQLKINDFFCEAGLLLSKCYALKNMPDKAKSIEKRIKPLLNKLDIIWLYEKSREFEQLYRQLQPIYQNETKPLPTILSQAINQRYETSVDKYLIIGQSAPMQEIYHLIEKIAPTDLPILIQGETGTGKELVARAIYHNSLRKENTWLALNCGAVPETLLENELFGHAKGAFTDARENKKGYIELASDGTLFLDEIGNMSPAMQQKLLRVLEEKLIWRLGTQKPIPVNTRFVFATNHDIEQLVSRKCFRLDLFHRINTIIINLPPLRERKEDIPLLMKHFLAKYASHRINNVEISPEVLSFFINYSWPGNIRELENEIKKICALYPDIIKRISESSSKTKPPLTEMLSETIRNYIPIKGMGTIKNLTDAFHRKIIEETLKKNNGNITECAKQLGFSRFGFYKKMKQLKINVPDTQG